MAKNKKIGQGINALISPESTIDIKLHIKHIYI